MAYDLTTVLGGGGGGIKSIQRGVSSISNSAAYTIATITAVDLSKSTLSYGGCYSNAQATYIDDALASARLSSSTEVFVQRSGYSNNSTVAWEVIEYE
jgi:hypothetical protein